MVAGVWAVCAAVVRTMREVVVCGAPLQCAAVELEQHAVRAAERDVHPGARLRRWGWGWLGGGGELGRPGLARTVCLLLGCVAFTTFVSTTLGSSSVVSSSVPCRSSAGSGSGSGSGCGCGCSCGLGSVLVSPLGGPAAH